MGWPTLAASVLTHGSCQRPHKRLEQSAECQTPGDADWNLRPCPLPGRPHERAGQGGHPHSPCPFVAHGPRRPQGGPRRQLPGWKIPGRQEERGPARSRLPAPPPPLSPPPPPPPGSPPVAGAAQRPDRRQGRGVCGCERACVARCAALRVRAQRVKARLPTAAGPRERVHASASQSE